MRSVLALGLAVLAACSHPAAVKPSALTRFYAHQVEPCGLAALEIAERPGGPFRLVQPTGAARPSTRLRYHVQGDLLVTGQLTGRVIVDAECGPLPELRVDSFAAWGPVRRIFSQGALDGQVHLYTEALPRDRFAPEDFENGPEPLLLDADACVAAASCRPGTLRQTNADGRALCCPPLR
jgi:hypothetical protein